MVPTIYLSLSFTVKTTFWLTIGSGTEIVENEARYGAGIYSQGNLTFTGGTFSQNNLLSGSVIGKDVYLAKNSSDVQTAITIGAESLGTGFSPKIGLAECTEGFQILLGSEEYIELSRLKFTIQNQFYVLIMVQWLQRKDIIILLKVIELIWIWMLFQI